MRASFYFLEEKRSKESDQEEGNKVREAFGEKLFPGETSFACSPKYILSDHWDGEAEPNHRNVVEDRACRGAILNAIARHDRDEEGGQEREGELCAVCFPHVGHRLVAKIFLFFFGELIKTKILHVPLTHRGPFWVVPNRSNDRANDSP